MSKKSKIWLIVAGSLVLVGAIVFCVAMTTVGWNFRGLSTVEYETNKHEITEEFDAISIVTNTADVKLVAVDGEESSVECYEDSSLKHSVSVKDGRLVIEVVDSRRWFEHIGIGINSNKPKITVSIPKGEYGELSVNTDTGDAEIPEDFKFESIDVSTSTGCVKNYASTVNGVKIKTSTGNINVEGISARSLDLKATTGKITAKDVTCEETFGVKVSTGVSTLTDVKCKSFISEGSTGDIFMENAVAEERISIERSTGDVTFASCDAREIFIETDTGGVRGTLLTEKVFEIETDTGKVDVPSSSGEGRCEIDTDTGDIKISIVN